MLHIPLLITFSTLFVQPLYGMEKETSERRNKFSISKRKKSAEPSTKPHHVITTLIMPRHSNDEVSMPSISITTSSTSMSTDTSQSESSKPKKYSRSKTVDGTSTISKETHKLKIFSSSEGTTPKISPRAMLTSSFKSFSQVKTAPQEKINILINAVKMYDSDTIEQYIKNPDANLNQIDQWGNTALHHAIIELTKPISNDAILKKIIILFLQDSRTDMSITNSYGDTVQTIMNGIINQKIEIPLFFARFTLDMRTNHEIGKMLLTSYIHNIPLDDNLMKQTIECIKDNIRVTEKEEGKNSIDLPQEATLPQFATDEFIMQMIKRRIPEEAHYVSEPQKTDLKNIFKKGTNNIILHDSININEEFSQESIETILKLINETHPYLIQFTTKPCIFEVLKSCIDQQEQQAKMDFAKLLSRNNTNQLNLYQ